MELFRQMVNEAIRIGLEKHLTSLKTLSIVAYPQLKTYETDSRYKLCAISRATGILKNHRKLSRKRAIRIPYCTQPSLTTCYGLKMVQGDLKMPGKLTIRLNPYTIKRLSQPGVEIRSVTISINRLTIAYRKNSEPAKCTGMIGIDRNLNNVTIAETNGNIIIHDLSKATKVKNEIRQVKRHFKRNDLRIRRRIYAKYGLLEKNRVGWILHNTSASIVKHAQQNHQAIVMENLEGIRKLYRKGNRQGGNYRAMMNSWSYYELQRQIEYKASWEGIPVIRVNARGTSAKCSRCGNRMIPEENRQLHCPSCKHTVNHDVNAARNILALGLRFRPEGSANEAMVLEPARAVIPKVDANQLTQQTIS
jgi:putative transposase